MRLDLREKREKREWDENDTHTRDGEMSRASFKAFCVEFYAAHVGKTGPEVYAAFEKSGLLRELDRDYEDLHGMGMEALMQMFDQWLGKGAAK
jgi:hypothetical protein